MSQGSSSLKDAIIKNLSNNIDELINGYELEIESLTTQIYLYKAELQKANLEVQPAAAQHQAINELTEENKMLYNLLFLNSSEDEIKRYIEKLRHLDPENSITMMFKLLKKFLDFNYFTAISYVIKQIQFQFKIQDEIKAEWVDSFIHFLGKLFEGNSRYKNHEDELVDCFLSVIQLCVDIVDTSHDINIRAFLMDDAEIINSRVLELNDTALITSLAQSYFIFQLTDCLDDFVQQVILEWDFIDGNVSEEEFIKLLWYMTFVEKDQELVDGTDESIKYMQSQLLEIRVYNLFNDILNGDMEFEGGRSAIDVMLNRSTLFTNFEKVLLMEFVEKRLSELEALHRVAPYKTIMTPDKQRQQKIDGEELRITEVSILSQKTEIPPRMPLKYRDAFLALYAGDTTPIIHHYTKLLVKYSVANNECFILKDQLEYLKGKEKGYWINIVHKTETNAFLKRERIELKGEIQIQHQTKPTEISKISNVINLQEDIEFNSQSALRNLGYQITGLTRAKRWEILSEKAVPKLGLKRVVETIAFLFRGRKAMKNGIIKNSYSINEWEYDLEKLKKHYYKNSFTWPKTTI